MQKEYNPTITLEPRVLKRPTQSSVLDKISLWPLLAMVLLLPIIVVPLTTGFISLSKLWLTFLITIVIVAFYLLTAIKRKSWQIILSPITIPLVLLGLSNLASSFFTSTYPVSNLLGRGGVYICFVLIALLTPVIIRGKKLEDKFAVALSLSSIILVLTGVLQAFGWGPSRLIQAITGLQLNHNLTFNLSGNSLIALQILLLNLVLIVAKVWKKRYLSTLNLISIPAILVGLAIFGWSILPGKPTSVTLNPWSASWSIALDSLRSPKAALIGQGPESYQNTYTVFKPTWINAKPFWQFSFSAAANLPLTLLVTHGLIGAISWALLLFQFLRKNTLKQSKNSSLTWFIAGSLIMQLFLPTNTVVLMLQAIAIAIWMASLRQIFPTMELEALNVIVSLGKKEDQQASKANNLLIAMVNSLLGLGLCLVLYLGGRAYFSYHKLYLASKAAANNQILEAHDQFRQAMQLNPYLDSNRREFALLNLNIARAISNKTDLTEAEQQQMTQLIINATREARAATALDPQNSQNWLALAEVYKSLIGANKDAAQFAVDAYIQAVQTNPANPALRLALGNLFFDQQQFNQAISFYNQAVNLKPDLPRSYYQLSRALYQAQQYEAAKANLQQILMLVPPDSEDYGIVQKDLATVDEKIQEASTAAAARQQVGGQDKSGTQPSSPSLLEENIQNPAQAVINQPVNAPLENVPEVDLEESTEADTDTTGLEAEKATEEPEENPGTTK